MKTAEVEYIGEGILLGSFDMEDRIEYGRLYKGKVFIFDKDFGWSEFEEYSSGNWLITNRVIEDDFDGEADY